MQRCKGSAASGSSALLLMALLKRRCCRTAWDLHTESAEARGGQVDTQLKPFCMPGEEEW